MQKCIIFGASKTGANALRFLEISYDVVGFCDNSEKKWGTYFEGKLVYAPDELLKKSNIKIIIASVFYSAINRQLHDMGITNVEVFYLLGSAGYNENNEYKLFKINSCALFEKCIYDKAIIEKVISNFSINYDKNDLVYTKKNAENSIKRVLFVAYIFPPLGGGGVQRSLYFVKYLKKFGFEPVVLTVGENDGKIKMDYSMQNLIDKETQIIRIDNKCLLPEMLSEVEQQEIFNLYCGVVQSEEWMNTYKEYINNTGSEMLPDNRIIWVNECLKQIENKINLQEIDIVFTTGNPFSTYIFGYYLKNKYGMCWIQDYRDPWCVNNYYWATFYSDRIKTKDMQRGLEERLAAASDAIVVDDEAEIYKYKREYSISESKLFAVTNGYDEDDFMEIDNSNKSNSKFILCYNGMLYGERNPIVVLEAINKLIKTGYMDRKDVCLRFNGVIEKRWHLRLEENDVYNIIEYNRYMEHRESLTKTFDADVLLLFGIEGEDADGGYTGKFFEYLKMRKPILALSSVNSSCEKILNQTGSGKNFSYNDLKGITNYILELYDKWSRKEEYVIVNYDIVKKYSRENLTKDLSKIFNKVLNNQ